MTEANAIPTSPSQRTARILVGLFAVATILALLRSPMHAWQPGVAAVLLCFRPRVSVLALALATSILLLVGGAVTTYRVGMAVPDWPQTMGQGMFSYPLDEMLESGFGVTLEHSHRLWATLVGLVSIMVVLTSYFHRVARSQLLLAIVALLAVIFQGILGGTRVIENDQHLAFLHGAFAQLYYALVIALLVVTSSSWNSAPRGSSVGAKGLRRLSDLCVLLVYIQVVLGAWLRHSGMHIPLGLHVVFALVVFAAVTLLSKSLRLAKENFQGAPESAAVLSRLRIVLLALLHTQVALGIFALLAILVLSEGFEGRVSVAEAILATLHLAVGAMLLGGVVASSMWSRRLLGAAPDPSVAATSPPSAGSEPVLGA